MLIKYRSCMSGLHETAWAENTPQVCVTGAMKATNKKVCGLRCILDLHTPSTPVSWGPGLPPRHPLHAGHTAARPPCHGLSHRAAARVPYTPRSCSRARCKESQYLDGHHISTKLLHTLHPVTDSSKA